MRVITLLVILFLSFSVAIPASAEDPECTKRKKDSGLCFGGGTDGSSVDISGSQTSPGGGADPAGGGADDGRSGPAPGTSSPSTDGSGLGGNPRQIVDTLDPCATAESCAPPGGGAPSISLQDLVSFSPTAPSIIMEPDGWMLRGLPANFIAEVPPETASGTLLGHPIQVRFDAASYTWTWGDGQTSTLSEAGRTWEDLGLPRFSETATSHTYAERGTVTVSLSVSYAVSYRLDEGDWTTVEGTVSASSTLDAYVSSAQTVLVPGDCRASPAADGC